MFVLDTDVISRTSPYSRHRDEVQRWLVRHDQDSYLSVLTFSELWRGASLLREKGATRKAGPLEDWIREVEAAVSDRLLPVDLAIGRRAGLLLARAQASGQQPSFVDACLAATAAETGFTVVTFNSRHFSVFGVPHRTPSPEGGGP